MGTARSVLFALVIALGLPPAAAAVPAGPGGARAIGDVRHSPCASTAYRKPGKARAVTYTAAFRRTLQRLHLLARAEDVARIQWDPAAHKKKQEGTVVSRGAVYDPIHYRNSGQVSAHAGGKNKWAVKFNRGHRLPFVDHDGVPFPAALGVIRLNPGTCNPFSPVLRGI